MEKKKCLITCLLVELLGVVSDITAIVLISCGWSFITGVIIGITH